MININIISPDLLNAPSSANKAEGAASVILQLLLQPGSLAAPSHSNQYPSWFGISAHRSPANCSPRTKRRRMERTSWFHQIGLMSASALRLFCRKASPGNLTVGLSEQNFVCYRFDKGFEVLQGITLASERQNGKFCNLLIGAAKYLKYLKAI